MPGISQTNVFPDQFSGGDGSRNFRSPIMRGRGPATTGIGQGIDNIAGALVGPNPAQTALADDRMAQADLRKAQLAKATADLAASKQQRDESSDPVSAIAEGFFPGQGKEIANFVKSQGVQAPPVAMDDEGNDMPKVPMLRPQGFDQNAESRLRSMSGAVATSRLLPGKTTYENATKGTGELQSQDVIRDALAGLLTPKQTGDLAAAQGGMKGNAQFATSPQGVTTNLYRGTRDETGDLAKANIGEVGARAGKEKAQGGQASAAAEASRAHAGLFNAQTEAAKEGGGKGSDTYQDQATGKRWAYKKGDAQAYLLNDDGTKTPVPVSNVPQTASKMSSPGAGGARENVYIGRVGLASAEAARDLENIAKLPLSSSTGLFGGRTQGPGLLDATKNVLANTVTGQEAQSYNVKATGLMRNLAAIEAAGLMPTGNLTHQMDAVMWKEGDTQLTKLQKLAQTRQIVEAGLDHVLANPRVSESEKAKLQEHIGRMQRAVPFSHDDLDGWIAAQEQNPNITFKQFLGGRKQAPAAAPAPKAGGGVSVTNW